MEFKWQVFIDFSIVNPYFIQLQFNYPIFKASWGAEVQKKGGCFSKTLVNEVQLL